MICCYQTWKSSRTVVRDLMVEMVMLSIHRKPDPEDPLKIICWWLWQQARRKDNLTPPRCLEWPHEFSQQCAWGLRGLTPVHWRELKLILIKGPFPPAGHKKPQFSRFLYLSPRYSAGLMLTGTRYTTCSLRFLCFNLSQIWGERRETERNSLRKDRDG